MTGGTEGADIPIRRVELLSYLVLLGMALTGWLLVSPLAGISVLIGGFVVILSFQWLKRDAVRLSLNPTKQAKIRFMLKCLGRLVVLGLLFYYLVRYQQLHIPGFLVGLATVQVGIVLATISKVKRLLKEA
ncbi:ATP synthase subunit I [Desulfurivibrio dismutans]|uniref:ATP synthase subunit I n=1 Tax=Desulfurivibrio dismutans TaxID=1398908 RepID=UPI0023D9EE67|nr:ATP synthase subunit I [Desulfurivibrio alkaliphilus]MDF1614273.1 ATP synthase subunit I [Desulfurivibrio alkaliphilus]